MSSHGLTNAAVAPRRRRITAAAAAVIGNALQFYDFFLYATAAALIFNTAFFPSTRPVLSVAAAFAGYAVGFVSRPIGGVVFGYLGDRYGRKMTLVWTLSLMGLSTSLIGVLPTYAEAGFLAPAALLLLRLLQGFAAGGEWAGGMLMATENASAGRRGLYGAASQAGVGIGFVLSASAFYGARLVAGAGFASWGWRLPFLASAAVVAGGLWIRSRVPESSEFEAIRRNGTERHPIAAVLRQHRMLLLLAGGVLLAEMATPLLTSTFALAYGRLAGVSGDVLLRDMILSMVADTLVMLLFGWLSDRIGRVPVYAFGIIGLAVFIAPFFRLLTSGDPPLILGAYLLCNGVFHAAMIGTQPALLTELFPASLRASGLALAQSIAAVMVGFIPLVATLLFYQTGTVLTVVALMLVLCAISLVSLVAAGRRIRAAG